MKKVGVMILLSLFLISFVVSQESPEITSGLGGDAETVKDAGEVAGELTRGNFSGIGRISKAEERIDAINLWLDENVFWMKIVFGMRPEISWTFAINFLLIIFFLSTLLNGFYSIFPFSEKISTVLGISFTIVLIQFGITVALAKWTVSNSWWINLIIIGALIALSIFWVKIRKLRKKIKKENAKAQEKLNRAVLEKTVEAITSASQGDEGIV